LAGVDEPLHGLEPERARRSAATFVIAGPTKSIESRSHRSISTIRQRPADRRASGTNCSDVVDGCELQAAGLIEDILRW